MVFEKYIKMNEKQIICGQTSSGVWYCKELPCDSTQELAILIGDINDILNTYNKKEPKEKKKD